MEHGVEFLRSQIDNAVLRHGSLLRSLEDHEQQADDPRYRDLCARHIPRMREHQRMLESFQEEIGARGGAARRLFVEAVGVARTLADAARESDYMRLVGDLAASRHAEDTFKTFREGGRALGIVPLAQIGEVGERHHDDYVSEANRLAQQLFVEQASGAERLFGLPVRTQSGTRL